MNLHKLEPGRNNTNWVTSENHSIAIELKARWLMSDVLLCVTHDTKADAETRAQSVGRALFCSTKMLITPWSSFQSEFSLSHRPFGCCREFCAFYRSLRFVSFHFSIFSSGHATHCRYDISTTQRRIGFFIGCLSSRLQAKPKAPLRFNYTINLK